MEIVLKKEFAKAKSPLCQLTSFNNIMVLVCLDKILPLLTFFRRSFNPQQLVSTPTRLSSLRNENVFEKGYEEATNIAKQNYIEVFESVLNLKTQKTSSN